MNNRFLAALLFSAVLCLLIPAPVTAEQPQGTDIPVEQPPALRNRLVDEMLLLDTAFRDIVSAVALADAERVRTALGPLHGSMEKTLEAVQSGAVKVPRNQQRIQEFASADKRFHENLEALDQAAQKKDLPKMLYLSKQLLDGCVKCHQVFRK